MSKSKGQNHSNTRAKTKKSKVLTLLTSKSGASIAQITKATGWQPHTIRAALTRLRQQAIKIERESIRGISRYRIPQRKAS